ncbi:MAG: GNAT family N-acetyltransferase, partial [Chitinophagales bacterium]
ILNFGFKVLNLNRIEADHFSENIASGTVLLKNNFTKEGIIREKRFENNKYHDVIVYGILKSEWESTT